MLISQQVNPPIQNTSVAIKIKPFRENSAISNVYNLNIFMRSSPLSNIYQIHHNLQ